MTTHLKPLPPDAPFDLEREYQRAAIYVEEVNAQERIRNAAPDLLAACEYLLLIVDGVKPPYTKYNMGIPVRLARAAIAKAKGETA